MQNWDPQNPYISVSGIPVNMTGFAQRVAEAGYKRRVFAGKADFGMAYHKQTPMGRGYTDALFYFQVKCCLGKPLAFCAPCSHDSLACVAYE